MQAMTIGRLASAAGVHVETIRYYQHLGLLATPPRPAGGVRRYDREAVERLGFIRRAQEAGFTLGEIAELLRLAERPNCRGAREIAARKLVQVQDRIEHLERIRSALRGLVRQCDAGGPRSCAILESFARGSGAPGRRDRGSRTGGAT
jgi:MerR family transcriptional regulator, mercuric resistance operon regulatory protein